MGEQADYIWMDGELVPHEDATVHFLAPALRNAFFEVVAGDGSRSAEWLDPVVLPEKVEA